jgi:drug/metabolite transporter (DMT)-like permease
LLSPVPFVFKKGTLLLSIFFGLSSALSWGAADFCGGLASRKAKAYQAVLLGEAIGLVFLLVAAMFFGESPLSWRAWLMCTIGGSMGVFGLLLFFEALSKGQMTIAAPVSALTAAILPVIVGSVLEKFPGGLTFAGFALALVAIWFISQPEGGPKSLRVRLSDLALPLGAGVAFGVYLVLVEQGSQDHLLWPMITSRTGGTLTMLLYALIGRKQVRPPGKVWPFLILNGMLDITGNGLYILAGQAGRLDVAAILASLYPASTVVLAGLFLHERLSRPQLVGILAALAAIVLMTIQWG